MIRAQADGTVNRGAVQGYALVQRVGAVEAAMTVARRRNALLYVNQGDVTEQAAKGLLPVSNE